MAETTRSAPIIIEEARSGDLPAMIRILAEGQVGAVKDGWTPDREAAYRAAFAEIAACAEAELLVARANEGDAEGEVLGMLHLSFLRGLPDGGALRATLQSVFVASAARGKGIGGLMVAEAERRARARGAAVLSLVSNKQRADAHRFYRTLGYDQSHEGFKKYVGGQS